MTFTESLTSALQCFDDRKGDVVLEARSLAGFGQQSFLHRPHVGLTSAGTPMALLNILIDGWSVRIRPVTTKGELPLLAACWKPRTRFVKRAWTVEPESEEAIAAALRAMPQPSLLIDGGHEVVAGWRLDETLRDRTVAYTSLSRLAARLGADIVPVNAIETWSIPFAGVIRNWTVQPADVVTLAANPLRRYTITEVMEAAHSWKKQIPSSRSTSRSAAGAPSSAPAPTPAIPASSSRSTGPRTRLTRPH